MWKPKVNTNNLIKETKEASRGLFSQIFGLHRPLMHFLKLALLYPLTRLMTQRLKHIQGKFIHGNNLNINAIIYGSL